MSEIQPIIHHGRVAALVVAGQAIIRDALPSREHATVKAMCLYALEVAEGRRASRFLCRRLMLSVTVTRGVSMSGSQFAVSGTRSPKWILNASKAVVQFRVLVHCGTAFCRAR